MKPTTRSPASRIATRIGTALLLPALLGTAACSQITHRGYDIPHTETLSVSDAQRYLKVVGYDVGRVDGILGSETRAALTAFATDEGLPGGGEITPELSHRLERRALLGDGSESLGEALAAVAGAELLPSVSTAQRRLIALGYKPGPVDGIMGPRTAAALRAFQRDAGLPVTGRLTRETAERLTAATG